ncbi:MAG: FAD-dependent oxidoreductase [Candidatus Pacearchaeota archaeon]
MVIYDLIIIGAGPAGLTASLYAGRYKLKCLLIYSLLGGTMTEAYNIENFPSYKNISGIELTKRIYEQIKNLKVEEKLEVVKKIEKEKKFFSILTDKNRYYSKTIIIATGREKAKLNLKNEDKFLGKGIHYCASCDAPFYKNKIVAVVGGGNCALNSSLLLSKYAKKVYIIYRKKDFIRADKILVDKIKKNKKIKILFNRNIEELIGKEKLEQIRLDNNKKIKVDGLFIEIGYVPNKEIFKNLKIKFENNYIKVNNKQETNIKGIFAAGDITSNNLKQIITACGEGAIAAFSAYNFIKEKEK